MGVSLTECRGLCELAAASAEIRYGLVTVLYTAPVLGNNGVQAGRRCKLQTLLKHHGKENKICFVLLKYN